MYKMPGRRLLLEEILNEKQIHNIVTQYIGGSQPWQLTGSEVKPAVDGIAGFLGDHMKAVINVDAKEEVKKVHLFIKRIPANNKPKHDFIEEMNYFKRERLMYGVFDDITDDGANAWCVKAFIYTDSIIVMPDLTITGYSCRHFLETLDSRHIFLATTSIARFHAAFVNYETKKSLALKRCYSSLQEFGPILNEPTNCDCPWLKTASKLSANILKTFSTKPYRYLSGLDSKLYARFLEACDSLTEYKDSVNVLIHKDLWVNNILFKYENGAPTNALLVDFQCVRYGPPAFDLMLLLYLTTDKRFRDRYEKDIFHKYYSVFIENLSCDSKNRLEGLGYDKENFLTWCEKGRMFGIYQAVTMFPFILMDPKTAQEVYDNPETYEKHIHVDRSEPVLAHAYKSEIFKDRNLEVVEDFVERYVLN